MRPISIAKNLLAGALALAALSGPGPALAQEVTLKLHQFLPASAIVPKEILRPWAENVETASNGRIKIEFYDAMALGGRPPELYDQARDGVVDIVMTLPGYTPGRFLKTEAFELPFVSRGSVATSKAFWEYIEDELQDEEYSEVKILGGWVHGPGVVHSSEPVSKLEDMRDKKLRGPTRVINVLLKSLGSVPVGMPVPAVPDALAKGEISGAVVPWEVTPAIKLSEALGNHTEFTGDRALYTATMILAMNKARYDSLPPDLKAILDAESGLKFSEMAANQMLKGDKVGRDIAVQGGAQIVTLDKDETFRWRRASGPVITTWVDYVLHRGIDGNAVIMKAEKLIKTNAQ